MAASGGDPVLVVGAGPVGLVAAAELARRRVPVRIIDKLAAPTTESRAIVVHARSLEMLDRIGVVEAIMDSGVKTTAMEMHAAGRRLARIDLDRVDSPFPFSITTAQTETERILTEFLAGQGVTVQRGAELTGLDQDAAGVRATVRHADGGDEVIAAPYLVGADGAHSTVRHLVGTALAGSFQGERFLMGDVEADCELDRHSMYTYFADDAGPLLDSYHAERHPVAAKVIEFTTRLTDAATLDSGLARMLRNTVLHAASGLAPVRQALANQAEETALGYRNSPVVIDAHRPRHALHAGDHLPDVSGAGLRQVLGRETGHVLVTIVAADSAAAAAAAPGARQVLVGGQGGGSGYDAVVADPGRRCAQRLGLPHGGRVMVRPDGYAGFVTGLADTGTVTQYATLLGQG